jgi:serine/threonine-protein kinase PknG
MDPVARLMTDWEVPEKRRVCGGIREDQTPCETRLTRVAGFCSMCGARYNFRSSLAPSPVLGADGKPTGELRAQVLDDNYEIKGPLAYGGLGWIYLALDRSLNRWSVLKGLINTSDPTLVAMARQEAQFLASLNHPNIAQVFAFLRHGTEGYINMEFVNGKNLLQIRREHGGPLPVPLAISYILNILPAFAFLDRRGLIYMDMKLENVMVVDDGQGSTVSKLIDLGAVRRADDTTGDLYATEGYAAPEVCSDPAYPSPVSDLYSVARALALLVCDFPYQTPRYRFTLPTPAEAPVFAEHESLYRFLTKATAEAPDARFQTADEMAQQLLGVLHEELVGGEVEAHLGNYTSALFDADAPLGRNLWEEDEGKSVRALPLLKVDADDPGASTVLASATIPDPERRIEAYQGMLNTLQDSGQRRPGGTAAPVQQPAPAATEQANGSAELLLRIADASISQRVFEAAFQHLAQAETHDPFDWRVAWYRGKALLAQDKIAEALTEFDAVFGEVPGEVAPKLALGLCYEILGQDADAIAYYDSVLRTDVQMTSAAFGLARVHLRAGRRADAVAALEQIPASSVRFSQAQLALASVLTEQSTNGLPAFDDLAKASEVIRGLQGMVEGIPLHETAADLYIAAATLAESKTPFSLAVPILDVAGKSSVREAIRAFRAGAEHELRVCAHYAQTREERVAYVDQANQVGPRRWW